jgi:hypothetical protein
VLCTKVACRASFGNILPLSISRAQIKDIAFVGVNSKDCDPASDNIFGLRSVGLRQVRPPQRAAK